MKKLTISILLAFTLIFSMASNVQNVAAYESSIEVSGAVVLFDISHDPNHDELEQLEGNFTEAGNTVIYINETFEIPDNADALFIPGSVKEYTTAELTMIKDWYEQGDKLLFIGGDSDFGGYFTPGSLNEVLETIGSKARLDATSISDPDNNDGAAYRCGVTNIATGEAGTMTAKINDGVEGGFILHGPCSILGYDGEEYIDLRTTDVGDIEILASYDEKAVSADSDLSDTPLDMYANLNETGNYPAVIYEPIGDSHLILAGESMFTYYKNMYNHKTETGVFQDGDTWGRMFVNNVINTLIEPVSGIPFGMILVPLALISTAVIIRKRKN